MAPALDCLQGNAPGIRPSVVTVWTCHPFDTDRDGAPDPFDTDVDNDRIPNAQEILPGGAQRPADTDDDGLPDYRDADSDGDTIADLHETAADADLDGAPNFRDRDADGDAPELTTATDDAREAGDGDPATPPVECPREIDARTLALGRAAPDGVPDFLDVDSDNDGLGDGEERLAETAPCNPDTDGDGVLDSIEVAYCRVHRRTRCATDPAVRPPPDEVWVALPYGGVEQRREVEFSATLRAVDVFFLLDTTARAEPGRAALTAALSAPRTSVVERLRDAFGDPWLGVGRFEDFAAAPPTGAPYGEADARPFWPLCNGPPGTDGCRPEWGVTVQPLSGVAGVQAAAQAFRSRPGGDAPGSQLEALYQTLAGDGLFEGDAAVACEGQPGRAPCWVAPRRCPEGTRGGACFRRGALPVVFLATATDFHLGAPDDGGMLPWSPYARITPPPHTFGDVSRRLPQRRRPRGGRQPRPGGSLRDLAGDADGGRALLRPALGGAGVGLRRPGGAAAGVRPRRGADGRDRGGRPRPGRPVARQRRPLRRDPRAPRRPDEPRDGRRVPLPARPRPVVPGGHDERPLLVAARGRPHGPGRRPHRHERLLPRGPRHPRPLHALASATRTSSKGATA